MSKPSPRILLAAVGAAALCVPLLAQLPAADASSGRHVVAHARPSWATASRAGAAISSATSVPIRVGLAPRDAAGAAAVVSSVSNPASPSYGRYLSAKQFTARYGPSKASVKRVERYLRSQGISVGSVADGNQWINARGTAASLNKAFGTTLRTYTYQGKKLRAPSTTVTVPATVGSDISTVAGLFTSPVVRKPMNQRIKPNTSSNARTAPNADRPPAAQCSAYWGQHQQTVPKVDGTTRVNTYECGLSPAQLRKIYGTTSAVKHGNDGHGQTVAIIDAYANPTMLSDANTYADSQGEPRLKRNQYTETVFKPFNLQDECGGEDGWNGEESLDVEAVHAMAPGAKIHYFGAQNCDTGIDDAINFIVQNHSADIVSNSYGNVGEQIDPAEVALEHNLFVQAGAEGIGFYFSSGDDGDNVINGLSPQPDYSASDPNVTAVGGTSELINKNGSTFATTGWETALDTIDYSGAKAVYSEPLPGSFYAGAGGGRSTLFDQPYYQKGTVPNKLASDHGQLKREVPDIAADADPYTGFNFGYTPQGGAYTAGAIGGTSVACPLIAGIQAVAQQNRRFPIGFANPLLYSLKDKAFHDIVPQGKIRFASTAANYTGTFEAGDTQKSRYGYDDITGRGTPNGNAFLRGEDN